MNLTSRLPLLVKTTLHNSIARLSIMAAITSALVFAAYVRPASAQQGGYNQAGFDGCSNGCQSTASTQAQLCAYYCEQEYGGEMYPGADIEACQQGCSNGAGSYIGQCDQQCGIEYCNPPQE